MPSVFDPGHGPLSSVDEWMVAVLALVVLAIVGAVLEYLRDAEGLGVLGAAVGVATALIVLGPPVLAEEWHYVLVALLPVLVAIRLYRGRGE